MVKALSQIIADISLWIAWFPFRVFIERLPMRFVNIIGKMGGAFLYVFSGKRRNIIAEQISTLFSKSSTMTKKEIKKITYKGLQIFSMRQMENLYWGKMTPSLLKSIVNIEGIANLDNALKKGNGVILLTAHFGSLLLPPLALGFKGYKINQIAGPPLIGKQRFIHRKIFNLRLRESERLPINFIVIGNYMRPVFNALCNNELLIIAFDGAESQKWVKVNFFGHKAFFSSGPFKISLKTKAPILPTFIIRTSDDTHRMIIESPFEIEFAENEEETLKFNTARFAKKFEGYIRKYPCHYAMTLMRVEELIQDGALELNFFQNAVKMQ